MKKPFFKFMSVCSLSLICAGVTKAAPHIFNITETAAPGDVVGIQGSGFSPGSSVWLDVMEAGDDEANPETNLVQVLTQSESYIAVRLPGNLASGMYAVFVSDGAGYSQPAWVNRAEGWHFLDLAGREITPGFAFQISGRNLVLAGSEPRVRFVNVTTGAALEAPVTTGSSSNDGLVLACTAPAGLVAGQEYHVEVNNGASTLTGAWSRVVSSTLLARAAGADSFGLGVPWAGDASRLSTLTVNVKSYPFNAVGNGVADDRLAVQWAIDSVWSRGGGTVYLPEGQYNIGVTSAQGVDYNLLMRSNVVLKGDGRDQTIIKSNGAVAGLHAGVIYVIPGQKNLGFHSLTLSGGSKSLMTVNNLLPTRSFMVNCRVTNDGGVSSRPIAWREGAESVFRDCQFISSHINSEAPYFGRHNDLVMKKCYFEYHDGRVNFVLSKRVQIQDCIFARSVVSDPANQMNYGGLAAPMGDFSLLDSSFVKLGDGTIPFANDGEAILCEYPSNNVAFGTVSSSTTTSLADSTVAWQANKLAGLEVVVIKGPGVGQRRKILSNTATSLVVSEPWLVPPVSGESCYSVGEMCKRHLVRGCVFNASPRGIWYYRSAVEDLVISSNTFMDTGYPVLVRGNQRLLPESYSMGNEFNTLNNLLVEKNNAQTSSSYPHTEPVMIALDSVLTSGSSLYGGFYYDCVIRGNCVSGNSSAVSSGIYVAHMAPIINNVQPSSVGLILQRNTVQNSNYGISIGTGNHQTVLWENTLNGLSSPVQDVKLPYHNTASQGTVVGQ